MDLITSILSYMVIALELDTKYINNLEFLREIQREQGMYKEIKEISEGHDATSFLRKCVGEGLISQQSCDRLIDECSTNSKGTERALVKVLRYIGFPLAGEKDPDFATSLGEEIVLSMPEEIAKKCKEIPSGVLLTGDPNAFMISNQLNQYAVVIDISLHALLSQFNGILLSRARNLGDPAVPQNINPVWAALDTMIFFRRNVIPGEKMRSYYSFPIRLDSPRTITSVNFTELQLRFVICHEYGHLLAGHLDQISLRLRPLPKYKFYNEVSVDEIDKSKADEFEADKVGFEIYSDWVENSPIAKSMKSQVGSNIILSADMFFSFLQLLECFDEFNIRVNHFPIPRHTHPPANKRRDAIRKNFGHIYSDNAWTLAKNTELVFRDIWNSLYNTYQESLR